MKNLLLGIILLTSLATAEQCTSPAVVRSSSDPHIFFRVAPGQQIRIRYLRPSGFTGDCKVRLFSRIQYRNGALTQERRLGSPRALIASKNRIVFKGPLTRRVRDGGPNGNVRQRSVLFVAANLICGGTVVHKTDLVGRFVPNCGQEPRLSSPRAYEKWLNNALKKSS
jgi:hypothetical protein